MQRDTVSLRLDVDVIEAVRAAAEADRRTVSFVINDVMRAWMSWSAPPVKAVTATPAQPAPQPVQPAVAKDPLRSDSAPMSPETPPAVRVTGAQPTHAPVEPAASSPVLTAAPLNLPSKWWEDQPAKPPATHTVAAQPPTATQAIVSRKDARAAEAVTYYTGKPCHRGHVAPRYVSNGQCSVCVGPASKRGAVSIEGTPS